MYLVAQFEKWLFRIITVFGTNALDVIRQKKSLSHSVCVFFNCIFFYLLKLYRRIVSFQGATVSYRFTSRKFWRFSIARASIKLRQHDWSLRCCAFLRQ